MHHQISLPHTTVIVIDNLCTPGLAACWFHRPWVRLKLPRNQSRDQYFPRLHRVTQGAHTLGTSMLCLWGCGSRGCISLLLFISFILFLFFVLFCFFKYFNVFAYMPSPVSALAMNGLPINISVMHTIDGQAVLWSFLLSLVHQL